jgi:predicted DNA-binding transcriptional regulator YafY
MQRLHALMSENQFPNCRKIALEFEVSPKTIMRDLNFMRDRLQLPIEYDKLQYGFRYTRSVPVPPIALVAERYRSTESDFEKPNSFPETGARSAHVRFKKSISKHLRILPQGITKRSAVELSDYVDVVLDFDDPDKFIRWVLGWGKRIQVLAPEPIRLQILQTAGDVIRLYE